MLCDGTRTLQTIQTSLLSIFGIRTSHDELKQLFHALDEAFLLENPRFQQALFEAREAFRSEPHRKAAHAGVSYPSDPQELVDMLNGFELKADYDQPEMGVRGVLSPHIDFARGGLTYAATWHSLKYSLDDIELAFIFGTDHHGNGELPLAHATRLRNSVWNPTHLPGRCRYVGGCAWRGKCV